MDKDTDRIELSMEQKQRVAELAQRTGWSWSDVLDYCIQHNALVPNTHTPREEAGGYIEDPALWQAHFNDWMSRQRPRNPNVDDSRENSYPDRA